VQASASAATPAAATGDSYSENWLSGAAVGAASLSALGLGLAAKNRADENSTAKCELCEEMPPWRMAGAEAEEEGRGGEEGKNRFRTIPTSELKVRGDDGKSERAFASALENGLFQTYDDGADDWEEADEEADNVNNSNNNSGNNEIDGIGVPATNVVTQHFVSFSPLSPSVNLQSRMSHRHTNRRVREEEDQHPDIPEAGSDLLATSDGGGVAAVEGKRKSDVIINKINTVRRNGLGKNQVYTKKMYFYEASHFRDDHKGRSSASKFRLFALPSSEQMGKEMAYLLGTSLNCIDVGAFTDGETSVKINDMVRGKEIYVVCATTSTNSIMELLLTLSALRRGSAKRICVVMPYFGYSRQDRRTGMKREPIAAADIAKLLEEMGADSVICVDLHNPLLKGFFSPTVPVDHLMPGPVAAAYFYEELYGIGDDGDAEVKDVPKEAPKITIVAAHENQVFRANGFRNALQKLSGNDDIRVALISNTKALNVHDKKSSSNTLVGDVEGRKCIIVDDIINTGGTLKKAIEAVNKSGASEIYAWATHGVLHLPENDAPEKIQEMDQLKFLLISNSVAIERELPPKIRRLSIAPLLAESVVRALHAESIRSMMVVKPQKSEK